MEYGTLAIVLLVVLFSLGAFVHRYEKHCWPPIEHVSEIVETTMHGAIAVIAMTIVFLFFGSILYWVLMLVGLEQLALPATALLAAAVSFDMLRRRARKPQPVQAKSKDTAPTPRV